jgi:3-dehydroquinate synthase
VTRSIQQRFEVSFAYPVEFTTGLFEPENLIFRNAVAATSEAQNAALLLVIDDGVVKHHPALAGKITAYCQIHHLRLVAPPLVLPGGEAVKGNAEHIQIVQDAIEAYGVDRHSYVVVVGGGALIDMVGYAAATAHRGVRLIRVPSTVLS